MVCQVGIKCFQGAMEKCNSPLFATRCHCAIIVLFDISSPVWSSALSLGLGRGALSRGGYIGKRNVTETKQSAPPPPPPSAFHNRRTRNQPTNRQHVTTGKAAHTPKIKRMRARGQLRRSSSFSRPPEASALKEGDVCLTPFHR